MAFESLSNQFELKIAGFPAAWMPLIYLYDPDLPLFPVYYFHFLDPALPVGARPSERDRLFGFIHHINLGAETLSVTVTINKDLRQPQNAKYLAPLESVVRQRLGLDDPVTFTEIAGALSGQLTNANRVLQELWHQVIDRSFGKALPFGCTWDPIFGLVRFIASWNSEGGRKGELIQTHYFVSGFGEHVATGSDVHVDFYLLPTMQELQTATNPLNLFPKFADLIAAADEFVARFCDERAVGVMRFSAFSMGKTGAGTKLDTKSIRKIIDTFSGKRREALTENYNAYNRGPARSVIALMMFRDLRHARWDPAALTPSICARMYEDLGGSWQSPKVLQLYAQQCFGSKAALPLDNWVKTFLRWPFGFSASKPRDYYSELFACSSVWGKIERIIWVTSQARKVHSSVCAEILWCVRYGSSEGEMRGANPFACKICATHIREVCPAYDAIKGVRVAFNGSHASDRAFSVTTSGKDNSTPGQTIMSCRGEGTNDEHSTRDRPQKFATFPLSGHDGSAMTVEEFLKKY